MTPFEVALFKHFMKEKAIVKLYISYYRKFHLKGNPLSVEEFLASTSYEKVLVSAFYFLINNDYGSDFWNKMNVKWREFHAANINNYTSGEWWLFRGMTQILRTDWDSPKPWRTKSRFETALRYGVDPAKLGIKDEPREVKAFRDALDAANKKDEMPTCDDFLGEFTIMDLKPKNYGSRRLKPNEVSLNLRNKKGCVTFNQAISQEIHSRGGYKYAALSKNKKTGDVALVLNDSNGVPMLDMKDATDRKTSNACINSKMLAERMAALLDVNDDYIVLKVNQLAKTDEYVAYLVTK